MAAPTRSARNITVAGLVVPRTPQRLTSETGPVTVVPPFRKEVAQLLCVVLTRVLHDTIVTVKNYSWGRQQRREKLDQFCSTHLRMSVDPVCRLPMEPFEE